MVSRVFSYKVILFLLLIPSLSWGQGQPLSPEKRERAEEYLREAAKLYAQAKYEQSIREYQFAGQIFRRANLLADYARCYNGTGNNYIDMTRYAEAIAQFQRALEYTYRRNQLETPTVADAYEGFGRYYMEAKADFKKALEYHEKALRIRELHLGEKHPKTARSYYFISTCYGSLSETGKELEYLEKALGIQIAELPAMHHETADTYQALGNYYYVVHSDYEKGAAYHKKAVDMRLEIFEGEHPKIASSYSDIANYYKIKKNYNKELYYLEKALEVQKAVLGPEHKDIAENYKKLGNRYTQTGDYDKALSYYQRALNIARRLNDEESELTAAIYRYMGLCYQKRGDARKEYEYLRKSLDLHLKIYDEEHYLVGDAYNNLGQYYGDRGMHDLQLKYSLQALDIWRNRFGNRHYFVAVGLNNVGRAYGKLNQPEEELKFLQQALDLKKDLFDIVGNDPRLYVNFRNLGLFYKKQAETDKALRYFQNAITSLVPKFESPDIYDNPPIQSGALEITLLEILNHKAATFRKRAILKPDKDLKDLEASWDTYSLALNLVDTLRLRLTSDGAKQDLTQKSIPLYEGAIQTLHELKRQTQDESYINRAFEVMERSKSFVLLQALQTAEAKGAGVLPPQLIRKEEELRIDITYYEKEIFAAEARNERDRLSEMQNKLFQIKQQYDTLITQIEQTYPRYYSLKHNNKIVSVERVQSELLTPDAILLEYFVGDEYIYVFRISKTEQQFFQLQTPPNLEEVVGNLRAVLTDYQSIAERPKETYESFLELSHDFYNRFFKPFLPSKRAGEKQEIFLIPDGQLNYIPFETLLQSLPEHLDYDYRSLDYIMRDHLLTYSYSATLLLENIKEQEHPNNGECLAFAPSYEGASQPGASAALPWAQREVKAIGQFFDGDYFIGEEATKRNFIQRAEAYSIVHLAMHGVVDDRNSMFSKLAFTQGIRDSTNPSDPTNLYAYELHNMTINADLVVLSACETGYGRVIRGEGVMSLARAFMYAGTPSVVMTLWKVNDYASATLMTLFYEELDKGLPKHEALHVARLRYLKEADRNASHPAFWGGFVSIGDPAPIQHSNYTWIIVASIAGLVLLGGIVFFWIRRQQKRKAAAEKAEKERKEEEEEKEDTDKEEEEEEDKSPLQWCHSQFSAAPYNYFPVHSILIHDNRQE